MNKHFNKSKILGIIILIAIASSLVAQQTQAKATNRTYLDTHYQMQFLSAEYLDADADGLEDDTRFSVQLTFDPNLFDGRTIKLSCYFEIITPSNTIYDYTGFIIMYCEDSIFIFDVFNTVTEPGWYTINFSSSFQYKGSIYSSFCTTIFDPPTGGEEGTGGPEISF